MTKINARNAARTAVAKAQANTATNKAGQQGRILEDTKAKAAAEKRENKPAKASKMTDEQRIEAAQALIGYRCEVVSGRKFKDEVLDVFHVSAKPNRFGVIYAMCHLDGEADPIFIDAKHLEATDTKMDAKLLAKLQKARKEAAEETLFVSCPVDVYTDRKTGEVSSIRVRGQGWFAPISMKPEWVTNTDVVDPDNNEVIYEVPVWIVQKRAGGVAVEALRAKQDRLEKLVNG